MFECRFCASLRMGETNYRIDARRSVVEILYSCETILQIVFPEGEHEWLRHCSGSSSQRLEKERKLPDK